MPSFSEHLRIFVLFIDKVNVGQICEKDVIIACNRFTFQISRNVFILFN